ncbi:two-component sensor histidine kinase [Bacillus luteolus]|uniref:histidine kinase n=1 Tax=Litchfieldia luteola TaxID=682179 RepID=A0ABR9QJD5_9BACI|nr:ATP-binding protein [Cytobacillus luteolus]MBE4908618.1 two-component sensor histidine kinase [Cytobacillus luteolus]MBP1941474.1 two-component system sporulation sensor kinase B [Cytobacillus luteolus]
MPLAIMELLIGLLFIFTLLFLFQIYNDWYDKKPSPLTFFLFSTLSMILVMINPFEDSSGMRFDYRYIPLILATLYGGFRVGLPLLVICIAIRFWYGGSGFYATLINSGGTVLLSILLHQFFIIIRTYQKVIMATTLSLVVTTSTLLVIHYYFNVNVSLEIWIGFAGIQTVSVGLITLLIETTKKTLLIREKIIRAKKLEAVSHLAASVGHEIRNPLTVTRGFLQLLQTDKDLPFQKRQEFLQIAMEQLDSAETIISDYLTFAKPDISNVEVLDIGLEIKKATELITPLANRHSVVIENNTANSHIKGDRSYLQQCLVNILKNSIEAMPQGGFLTIQSEVIEGQYRLSISDTGIGMTNEQLKRLGEPYFTTKGYKGTGLGMMVVYSLIKAMSGSIDVTSEIGKGTQFTINFPIVKQELTIEHTYKAKSVS